ncbi:MAG: hypothetical protein AAGA06_05830 [Pseudomonadota bacterium]
MSLATMLDTHDEAALSALASVGLVRRATRDLAAGKASVVARDADTAMVAADGQDVAIDAGGPGTAKCGCPATGVCRHVILAILALREDGDSVTPAEAQHPSQSAREETLGFTDAQIRKFAGADWDKAVRQAGMSADATVTEDGANLSVQLPDTEKPITLLAGLGLQGAVFKGPKTTKRRVVTAAALVVRVQAGGQSLEGLAGESPAAETLTTEFLDKAHSAVIELTSAVLGGGSTIAEERVFDLAISARAQAAPRLTALLRVLARQARQARAHHFAYDDARFLGEAALTVALTHALQAAPSAPDLTGVVRRTYVERDSFDLALLGAVKWKAEGGARGARLHGVDPSTGIWYSTGQARGAGMDPSFTPQSVYNAPLWGLGRVDTLVGTSLHLEHPRISSDNQIAWDGAHATRRDTDILVALAEAGILHTEWSEARADMARRMPGGLKWVGNAVPILIAPQSLGDIRFDDIAQAYEITAQDVGGTTLTLTVPADRTEDMEWLHRNHGALVALFCEATVTDLTLRITPMTAYLRRSGEGVKCVNLTFDHLAERFEGGRAALGGRIQSFLKSKLGNAPQTPTGHDPVRRLCDRAFEAVAEALRFGNATALPAIITDADTLGLATLARALDAFEASRSTEDGLRASYVASEVLKRAG